MIRINKEVLDYITKLYCAKNHQGIEILDIMSGQHIIEQQSNVYDVYIVKSGLAKCYLTEDTGKDFIQEFFGEGEVFGEVEMFNDELSFCTIEAINQMEVFRIKRNHFTQLVETDTKLNKLILKTLAQKIRYTALRHSYHQSHPIRVNLLRLQKQFPNLIDVIAKRDIANYLGITERSLNRNLKTLNESKNNTSIN